MRNRIIILLGIFLFLEMNAIAQCALCTKTAAGLDDKSARGLNGGIIYLAAMPLAIIGLLGFKWYRHYKSTI